MNIKFQTDQTGANQNVCSGTSLTFNFSLAQNSTLDSANFVIKKGSTTTLPIVATVYSDKNGGGSVVAQVSVLAADITQSFTTITFIFNTNLTADLPYSLVVSSTSSCSGSSPYSMKSGNFQVLDSANNTIINTGYGISASISSVNTTTSSATLTQLITSSLSAITSSTLTAYRQHNILSSISCITNKTCLCNYSASANSSINNICQLEIQATKSTQPTDNRVRIDGRHILDTKIYLGNKRPNIYHGQRQIIRKPQP